MEFGYKLHGLTEILVRFYAPIWFSIKTKAIDIKRCKASLHGSRIYRPIYEAFFDAIVESNDYFRYAESVFLAKLSDDNKAIHHLAFGKILKARSLGSRNEVRKRVIPSLSFGADNEWIFYFFVI